MSDMDDLISPRALVCRREINCDQGVVTVHMLLLADGFLIDCGSGAYAAERVHTLADIINADKPERLSKAGLKDRSMSDVPF